MRVCSMVVTKSELTKRATGWIHQALASLPYLLHNRFVYTVVLLLIQLLVYKHSKICWGRISLSHKPQRDLPQCRSMFPNQSSNTSPEQFSQPSPNASNNSVNHAPSISHTTSWIPPKKNNSPDFSVNTTTHAPQGFIDTSMWHTNSRTHPSEKNLHLIPHPGS